MGFFSFPFSFAARLDSESTLFICERFGARDTSDNNFHPNSNRISTLSENLSFHGTLEQKGLGLMHCETKLFQFFFYSSSPSRMHIVKMVNDESDAQLGWKLKSRKS